MNGPEFGGQIQDVMWCKCYILALVNNTSGREGDKNRKPSSKEIQEKYGEHSHACPVSKIKRVTAKSSNAHHKHRQRPSPFCRYSPTSPRSSFRDSETAHFELN